MADVQAKDWRDSLQPDSRTRIINKICDTLMIRLPVVRDEELAHVEIRLIATRFENKIYEAATSQSEYLRRISLKMLSFEAGHAGTNASGSAFNAPPYDEL